MGFAPFHTILDWSFEPAEGSILTIRLHFSIIQTVRFTTSIEHWEFGTSQWIE